MKNCKIKKCVLRFAAMVLLMAFPLEGVSAPRLPEPDLSWKNVSVDNRKTAVYCLYKDRRGIMWLGTNGGLYFYDGVTTHPVGKDELAGTQIYSLVEDDNKLYVGSNNGLYVYDYESGEVSRCDVATPDEIRALLLVDGNLWIGSLNGLSK